MKVGEEYIIEINKVVAGFEEIALINFGELSLALTKSQLSKLVKLDDILKKTEYEVHDKGFKEGEKFTKTIMQSTLDNEREYGRNEAWEIAKKVSKPRSESEWKDFFDFLGVELWHPYDIFMKYTPTEVIEKLEEYEERKQKSCYKCNHFAINNIYCRNCCDFSKFEEKKEQPWYMQIFNQEILDEFTKHMRDATPEERQSVQDYINSISTEVPYNNKNSYIPSEAKE